MGFTVQTTIFLLVYWSVNTGLNVFRFLPGIADLDRPLDGGAVGRDGRPLLGRSTTVIGMPVALLVGLAAGQIFFGDGMAGIAVGAATYIGHGVGSFTKRRLGCSGGRFLPIIDHGDSVIVAGVAMVCLGRLSWASCSAAIIVNYLVQPALCYLGYRLGLRERPL